MEWKWACKICSKLCDNERELMLHYFFEHREAAHYGVPVAVGDLPIPTKAPKKPKKVKKALEPDIVKEAREAIEEEELPEAEDLSIS